MQKIFAALAGLAFAIVAGQASAAMPSATPSLTGADHVKFDTKAKKGKGKSAKKAKPAAK